MIRRRAGGAVGWDGVGVYRRSKDEREKRREGGSFFNVPGSRPAEVSRLSWLCKLPRERCTAEGRRGETRAQGGTREGEMACPFL